MIHRFLIWVRAFLEMLDALIVILTFTTVIPTFGLRFFIWQVKRDLKYTHLHNSHTYLWFAFLYLASKTGFKSMNIKEIINAERWNGFYVPLHNAGLDRIQVAVDKYIAELEAQIPKTVTPVWTVDDFGADYFCTCGFDVLRPQHYCENCGSKLNWEDTL